MTIPNSNVSPYSSSYYLQKKKKILIEGKKKNDWDIVKRENYEAGMAGP